MNRRAWKTCTLSLLIIYSLPISIWIWIIINCVRIIIIFLIILILLFHLLLRFYIHVHTDKYFKVDWVVVYEDSWWPQNVGYFDGVENYLFVFECFLNYGDIFVVLWVVYDVVILNVANNLYFYIFTIVILFVKITIFNFIINWICFFIFFIIIFINFECIGFCKFISLKLTLLNS